MTSIAKRTAHSRALECAVLALMAAILLALQVALAPLPNIEIVSLLIVLYTRHLGKKTLPVIYLFVLLEGLIYGFGLWFVNYLYIWTLLWAVTMLLRRMNGMFGWVVVLAVYGLSFGFLCAIPYLFMGGVGAAVSYFISGIPFDIAHCAGNAVLCLFLFKPLDRLFAKLIPKLNG